jgi:hypothetical protein|tara:strand:- start:1879 stop:2127 length:249 start_codon:yes stop_codon:yes gene_type:complete
MLDQNQDIEFSDHDLEVIEEALFTQEKILSVQSRAGGNGAKTRLNELQGLLQRMRRQRGDKAGQKMGQRLSLWGQVTRMISC